MPVVLTVVKEINEPRLPSLKGKLAAKKKEIAFVNAEQLDVYADRIGLEGSPTQVIKIFTPPRPKGGKIIEGEVPDAVAELIRELKEMGVPLGEKKKEN
jgi:electron transfer flavoprotein beta subunit